MTDARKLQMVKLLIHAMEQSLSAQELFTEDEVRDILVMLEGFKEELEIQTFVVGEKVEYKFYDEWMRATVEKLGKVRVGIQIIHFSKGLKYVSPKKLRKVEPK
jgi:hypothetical protein